MSYIPGVYFTYFIFYCIYTLLPAQNRGLKFITLSKSKCRSNRQTHITLKTKGDN